MNKSISATPHTQRKGFTLIEIVIIVTVIVILTGISAAGMNIYLKNARDGEREGKATILTNALEAYYDKNGEYPSCSSLANSDVSAAARVLGDVDEDAFKAPNAPEGTVNSITCTSTAPNASLDTFVYGSTLFPATSPITDFTLRYWSESDNEVKTVSSRRRSV